MNKQVVAEMITLARDSRGLTQGDLAERLGVSQGKISKYESGILQVSDEDLSKLCKVLDYPPVLFFRPLPMSCSASGCLYHRKRQSMPVLELRRIQATLKIIHMQTAPLLRGLTLEDNRFYRMDVDDYKDGPAEIASILREKWGIQSGPVPNLVNLVELAGGIVFRCSFGNRKLDAISLWQLDMPPFFFLNSDAPSDRVRFSLAHEVGHVIMHRNPTADQERQADQFAAEFLMPAREVAAFLKPISVEIAASIKPYWKTSMAALIYRARQLNLIGESYYRKLFTQMSRLGFRRDEPNPVAIEEPTVLRDMIDVHLNDLGYSEIDLCKLMACNDAEFRFRYLDEKAILRLAT
jgi:Zn-dependent peptidase ImmA (M78 family)/transcriptional regulator with XRE-family HTH domain